MSLSFHVGACHATLPPPPLGTSIHILVSGHAQTVWNLLISYVYHYDYVTIDHYLFVQHILCTSGVTQSMFYYEKVDTK